MKTYITRILLLAILVSFTGCSVPLSIPTVQKAPTFDKYRYAYITPTQAITSTPTAGFTSFWGYNNIQNAVNPADIISGILIKRGYIIIPEIAPELKAETIIVNYAESGERTESYFEHAVEIIIQIISADNYQKVAYCKSSGSGTTSADAITVAITRGLDSLFAQ